MVHGLFLYITYVYLQLNRLRLCTVQPPTVLTTITMSTQQMCWNNGNGYQCRCSTQQWWKGLSSSWLMEADHGVFYKEVSKHFIIFAVHVDHGMVTRSSISLINKFKEDMNAKYKLTDLGTASWLLGNKISRDLVNKTLSLSQHAYIDTILMRFNFDDLKPSSIPISLSIHQRHYLKPNHLANWKTLLKWRMYLTGRR